MLVLHEKALFAGTLLEVELHHDMTYRLRYGDMVEYSGNRKTIRKKTTPYAFKSVEQLRYDFEQDVKAAGGKLGEDS